MHLTDFLPRIITNLWEPTKGGSWFYKLLSKSDVFKPLDLICAYEDIPEVAAVINMKAHTWSNMRIKEVDKDGNEKQTTEGQALIKLLQNPNWFQGGHEFLIQTKLFRELFGNEYIFKTTPLGFNPTIDRVKALYTIPDNIVKVDYDGKIPYFLNVSAPKVGYKIKNDTGYDTYNQDQIIHFNDNRVSIKSSTDKDILKGQSRLNSLKCAVNNIRLAYESRGVILKNRGANGAWVNAAKDQSGTIPMDPKDKEAVQAEMRNYGTLSDQNQDIITNIPLTWVQRGTNNPANLGIFQEIEEDFNKILDGFGVPSEVFVRTKGATYENQRQAEKGLYVRTIIPEANEWVGGLSSEFLTGETKLVAEYTHLPIFQEDLKSRGEAMNVAINALSRAFQDQAISIEQYREELLKFGIK